MTGTERLAEELRRQAQDRTRGLPDHHPLSLQDVQSRARGIRRRRYAASGLAATAVLAVTVPLGLAAGDRFDRTSTGPVDRPGERRSVVEDGTPVPDRRLALTSDVPSTSDSPRLGYLAGDAIHLPDGSQVEVEGDHDTLLPLGDGYVVGSTAPDTGERSTGFLDASGDLVWTEPSVGAPVLSPSGRLAAFGRADGTTVTVEVGGERRALLTRRPADHQVAAVLDEGGSCTADGAICTVFTNSTTVLAATALSATNRGGDVPESGETVDDLAGQVEAVSRTGRLALTVSADAGSLCSAVEQPGRVRLWRTCAWQLGAFSPDERFVVGYPLGDGGGPRGIALLDAMTGAVVREYAAPGRADVFVNRAVWESTDAVLATVWDTDHWSVLRLGLDGARASVPAAGLDGADDPDSVPVVPAG